MRFVWNVAFVLTLVVVYVLNSMVPLAVMIVPLSVSHVWLTLRETRP